MWNMLVGWCILTVDGREYGASELQNESRLKRSRYPTTHYPRQPHAAVKNISGSSELERRCVLSALDCCVSNHLGVSQRFHHFGESL